jgi:ATP-dependent helicase/nuclease subunit A
MRRDDATERQVQAADPILSTWLSANAGSGKTRVLTDRVARLLLAGTEPQKVLCLTYTKAAAAEMQNRLLKRLGEWAMLPDARLRQALLDLGETGLIDTETLARARRLFAKAIETPGGLKIQTIHSFCAALLRRFPLEAGVPHGFAEMDDRAGAILRAEILDEMAAGGDLEAIDALARHFPGEDFDKLLGEICRHSDAFEQPLSREGALALFDLPAGFDMDDLLAEVFLGDEVDLIAALVPALTASSANDSKAAAKLRGSGAPGLKSLLLFEDVLLTGSSAKVPFSAKIGSFPTKGLANGAALPMMDRLEALMRRVEAARPLRCALMAAEKTLALHRFAGSWLPDYARRKAARGWLDFDDLIRRAGQLLSDPSVAQWVLFRLDGGIDHILVDEAQDTSPGQWLVIERLSEEFTAGAGARGETRTLFVVGDRKQSIYSFQGADLREFEKMRDYFSQKFDAAGQPLQNLTLEHSFRSSEAILRLVDLTFDERVQQGLGGETRHRAFNTDLPGRVDLWEPVPKASETEEDDWQDPVDLRGESHETVVLARRIAAEIKAMIARGERLPGREGARPVHEGDFLILVQRRSALFAEIIRACKAAGLAIAGADRLKLGAELAVRDIGALLAFLATPEDDLSLAAVLRSPLFGWSEGQLYTLAQPRPGYLWEALRNLPEHAETVSVLGELRDSADFLRPYELIERLLTRHGGRDRLVARLGPEAEDGIDELLSQALAFERSEVPSLTGFLGWLQADDVEVKRQLDSGGRAIRVMTVHGSKGLEAPIVILPETAKRRDPRPAEVLRPGQGPAIWRPASDAMPPIAVAERDDQLERQREERMRLLYVALTRAEKWLILCAAGEVGTGPDSWYGLVADAMQKAGAESGFALSRAETDAAPFQRLSFGDWPEPEPGEALTAPPPVILPVWTGERAAPVPEPDKALSPSDLGGAKALPGELGLDEEAAKRHGRQLHLLLEHLPDWPEADWPAIAASLLLTGEDAALAAEIDTVLAEARRVLTATVLAPYHGPEALAEVELTAILPELGGRRMHGIIDRLVITADRILLLDYKSNRTVPRDASAVPEGILRQMGAYVAALNQIYPDRPVEAAVFWTASGDLMPLPIAQLGDALRATPLC